jgi:RNA polymerase sigma factor (sigma-70 family)
MPTELATAGYQELIERHAHLVSAAVSRIESCLPVEVDRGVLVGKAIMALVDTAHRVPPGRSFEQQARAAIWSGIIAWLGSQPWLCKRPRESADRLYEAYLKAGRSFESASDSTQVAARLQVTEAQLQQWLSEVAAYFTAWPGSFLGLNRPEDSQRLAWAISKLPPQQRLVVTLSHYEELSPEEIAAVLAIPVERINRAYAEAGLQLRALLADAA